MHKTFIFPLFGFIAFLLKLALKSLSTTTYALNEVKEEVKSEFDFARDADENSLAYNSSYKSGKKGYKKMKKAVSGKW
jgi:hypothetical protein